ncbi:restriction endonuclease subunit S [Ligilactobacillus salivarius]|uniref:restriction endonuclease subunit S n=1 Tax=Ligilactobacillus salivarius TaxID=1624 RepID=UPI0022E87F21|nr:restriction endonuclease subunit S [Ligilactobacillus salivarius]
MKDSGIEWIGEIPEKWEVTPLYMCFTERRNKNRLGKEKNLLSLSYGHIVQKNIEAKGGLLPESFTTYNIIEPGDIIIRPTDLQNDKRSLRTGLSNEHGIITSAYIDLKPLKNVNSNYYHYLLHSYDIQKVFYNMGNGVRQGLNYSEFSKLRVLAPESIEQQQIANFLDRKTTEIDELIDKINIEIDTLKQYQSSVITQAVTKGLDPNVQMKDSGIEWIGEIPETWKTIKIKYLVDKLERGTAPKYTELYETQVVNQATFSKGFFDKSNMRYSTIPASQSRGLLQYQDVLVASTGGGVLGKVHYFTEHEEFVADSHVTIVRFIAQKLIPKFGYYYLSTLYDVFNNVMAQGSTNQIELKRDTFANSFIPFPRIEEQRVIVDYLDQKVTQIQKLINSKQQQINQLTEYKNSLIFEYVTGKKQVKEAN